MKDAGRALLASAVLAGTLGAMYAIAVARNEAAAGGGAYRLEPARRAAFDGWQAMIGRLRRIGAAELAERLQGLQAEGKVWVAPRLDRGLRAVWVSTLAVVERVYIAERELVSPPGLLYPDLDVPPAHLRTFAWISLAGTLLHELAHARGVVSEERAYALEIEWLRSLASQPAPGGPGAPERLAWEWAVPAAVANAERARRLRGQVPPPGG